MAWSKATTMEVKEGLRREGDEIKFILDLLRIRNEAGCGSLERKMNTMHSIDSMFCVFAVVCNSRRRIGFTRRRHIER